MDSAIGLREGKERRVSCYEYSALLGVSEREGRTSWEPATARMPPSDRAVTFWVFESERQKCWQRDYEVYLVVIRVFTARDGQRTFRAH